MAASPNSSPSPTPCSPSTPGWSPPSRGHASSCASTTTSAPTAGAAAMPPTRVPSGATPQSPASGKRQTGPYHGEKGSLRSAAAGFTPQGGELQEGLHAQAGDRKSTRLNSSH